MDGSARNGLRAAAAGGWRPGQPVTRCACLESRAHPVATTTREDTSPAAIEGIPPLPGPRGQAGMRRSGTEVQATRTACPRPLSGQGTSVIVPFISAEWPGKLQKNEYPSPSLATGTVNEVLSPPPTTLLWATTRASPALT